MIFYVLFIFYRILKRHNQAKLIKKSVFVSWFLNMAIRCQLVHTLELQKSFNFTAAVATWQLSVPKALFISYSRIPILNMHACPKLNFVLISRLAPYAQHIFF